MILERAKSPFTALAVAGWTILPCRAADHSAWISEWQEAQAAAPVKSAAATGHTYSAMIGAQDHPVNVLFVIRVFVSGGRLFNHTNLYRSCYGILHLFRQIDDDSRSGHQILEFGLLAVFS